MVRLAEIKDISIIVEFNIRMAKETEGLVLDRNILSKGVKSVIKDNSKGMYYLCEQDGIVVGQLLITKEWSDWRNADFWWIQSVYVEKSHRRSGVFKKLYRHVKKLVDENSSTCGIRLYVEKNNLSAQKTYFSMGMKPSNYFLYEYEPENLHTI